MPAQSPLDDALQADKCTAANEQDVCRIHADILLLRMLTAALRRHVADRSFQNLQQGLLHALA